MNKLRLAIVAAIALLAAGCSTPPAVAPTTSQRITEEIVRVCTATGFFRSAEGLIDVVYPVATLPLALVNAGVDRVCTNPALYANDIGTVEWLIENLRSSAQEK